MKSPRNGTKYIAFIASAALIALMGARGIEVRRHPIHPGELIAPSAKIGDSDLWQLIQRKDFIYIGTVVFLTTTGSHTWPTPSDWNNAANTIECIAGGAGGGGGASGFFTTQGGGGGGAYAAITNLTISGNVSYLVGVGGSGASIANGGFSWFKTTGTVLADHGYSTTDGSGFANQGGQDTNCVGTTVFSGGPGNGGGGETGDGFGVGGGGAAGPTSTGNPGSNDSGVDSGPGGDGGTPNGGTGGVAVTTTIGSAGSGGTTFDGTHGTGGGGSGGGFNNDATTKAGGAGGLYGGGGGSGGGNSGLTTFGNGGNGGQGIIVITYTPLPFTWVNMAGEFNDQTPRRHWVKEIVGY